MKTITRLMRGMTSMGVGLMSLGLLGAWLELVSHDVLQNKEIRLCRDTIKERKQNGSMMPAGLADTLTREAFRDLNRFLSELGRPK